MIESWQDARIMFSLVFSLGLVMGAVGCTGSSSEPAVSETTAPLSPDGGAGSKGTEPNTAAHAGVVLGMPETTSDPSPDERHLAEARAAFRVLVTPGTDSKAWEAAQQQLVALGPSAVPVLLAGLKSENAVARETAATVCALTGAEDVRIQTALVQCLSDEVSFVRANAAAALAQVPEYQPQVMSTLTDLLADSDPQLRRMAAANLGSFGAEASAELPKLTAVLTDDDSEVVTPVIQLLGRIGPLAVDAVPQLQKIAFEQDGELKQAAEQALLLIQADGGKPVE